MINTKDLVIIDKAEYAELVGKAAIYDAMARKLKADADRGGYITDYEQAMFVEEPEAIFTEEEWEEKVVSLAEGEEVKEV